MKGDHLPDAHRVSSYIKPSCRDDPAGALIVTEQNPELSVNWIEFLKRETDEAAIEEIVGCLRKKLTIRPTGVMAIIGVGAAKAALAKISLTASIVHDPEECETYVDRSHSLLQGIPFQLPIANAAAQMIAEAIVDRKPVPLEK